MTSRWKNIKRQYIVGKLRATILMGMNHGEYRLKKPRGNTRWQGR